MHSITTKLLVVTIILYLTEQSEKEWRTEEEEGQAREKRTGSRERGEQKWRHVPQMILMPEIKIVYSW